MRRLIHLPRHTGEAGRGKAPVSASALAEIMILVISESRIRLSPSQPPPSDGEVNEGGRSRIADTLLTKKCRNPPPTTQLPGAESLQVRSGPV